ncbi:MAG: hypothetical protein AAB971_00865 [Patescibacteria group bacterium]
MYSKTHKRKQQEDRLLKRLPLKDRKHQLQLRKQIIGDPLIRAR